jgi:hypothetical protein
VCIGLDDGDEELTFDDLGVGDLDLEGDDFLFPEFLDVDEELTFGDLDAEADGVGDLDLEGDNFLFPESLDVDVF